MAASLEQAGEEIVVGVGMAEVLAKALGESETGGLAVLRRPGLHALEVLIDAVLLPEPLALGFMGGGGLGLPVHDVGDGFTCSP